jgi:transcriptional regulator with XRE-family HTH domain
MGPIDELRMDAERLRALRRGKPQRQIAAEVGVTERAYQRWEKGGAIEWENLEKLAGVYGVAPDYLIAGSEAPAPQTQLDRIEEMLAALLGLIDPLLDALLDDGLPDDAPREAIVQLLAERAAQREQSDEGTPASAPPRRRSLRARRDPS